jgi:rubrerythrin
MTTNTKADLEILRTLELCRDIELYNAELYRYYAEIFQCSDPELSAMWQKTADEEDNHANQFVLAIKLRKQNLILHVGIDSFRATTTLNFVKSIFDGVRKNKPSAVDALRSAIKLEMQLEGLHMDSIAFFNDETHRKLFEAMMKADNAHLERIQEAYKLRLR